MKNSSNNEIELILRGMARRRPAGAGSEDEERPESHLDADELSSYVEGALPPATRARYTAHIADCQRCRRLVSQLSEGVPTVERQSPAPLAPPTVWQKVGEFFSPAVL